MSIWLSIVLLGISSLRLVAMDQHTAERITLYCKVWGFLKYYHPGVAERTVNWDEVFIEHYSRAKQASSQSELDEILWSLFQTANSIEAAEIVDEDEKPRKSAEIVDFSWINDSTVLQKRLRDVLRNLKRQSTAGENYYIEASGNPVRILRYPNTSRDSGYYYTNAPGEPVRMLALARYWNIINYYAPNKILIGASWDSLLTVFTPRVAEATDSLQYLLAMLELTRKTHDGNANIVNESLIAHIGAGIIPAELSFVEGKTVVMGGLWWARDADSIMAEIGIAKGDVILSINDQPIHEKRNFLAPYVTSANETAHQFEISARVLRGRPDDTVTLVVENAHTKRKLVTTYRGYESLRKSLGTNKSSEVGRFSNDEKIAYIDISKFTYGDDIKSVLNKLTGTSALILDHRKNTPIMIAHYLTSERQFAQVLEPNYEFPGFTHKGNALYVGKLAYALSQKSYVDTRARYRGRIVVLVNELTGGVSELLTMALQAIPGVVTIGSQTAGSPGFGSTVWLPGKLRVDYSGLSILYPDDTPTQRVGLKIDREIKPTLKGIREGRDEVLEYAIDYLKAVEEDK